MTAVVFGYLILINMNFHDFFSPLPRFDRADYETLMVKSVLNHLFKHVEVRQKYSATWRIFQLSSWYLEMWSDTMYRRRIVSDIF